MKSNKLMAVAVLALSALFLLSQAALAHTAKAKNGSRAMSRMTQELNLTADQQAKIKPIFASEHSQMRALKKDTSLTAQQRREKMKEIRQTADSQIKQVLTADQQTKWQQLRAEKRAAHKRNKTAAKS